MSSSAMSSSSSELFLLPFGFLSTSSSSEASAASDSESAFSSLIFFARADRAAEDSLADSKTNSTVKVCLKTV